MCCRRDACTRHLARALSAMAIATHCSQRDRATCEPTQQYMFTFGRLQVHLQTVKHLVELRNANAFKGIPLQQLMLKKSWTVMVRGN